MTDEPGPDPVPPTWKARYPSGEGHASEMTPQECAQTHPGFSIMCQRCGSTRVIVENDLGFSAESGGWGACGLWCLSCHATCTLVGED